MPFMKKPERFGLLLVFAGLGVLVLLLNIGNYKLSKASINNAIGDSTQATYLTSSSKELLYENFTSKFAIAAAISDVIGKANEKIDAANAKNSDAASVDESDTSSKDSTTETKAADGNDKVTAGEDSSKKGAVGTNVAGDKPGAGNDDSGDKVDEIDTDIVSALVTESVQGPLEQHTGVFLLLVLSLFTAGTLIFSFAKYLPKHPGISNNNVFKKSLTSRGVAAVIVGIALITFYCVLYWYPYLLADLVKLVDPLSRNISGAPADYWFLYGTVYSVAVLLLGIKMFLKYRHSIYQQVRTVSVTFFQLSFAFIIPEILKSLNKPSLDLKNIWPLDYSFFWNSNVSELISSGRLGIFMLVWGIILLIIIVPLFTYFFGKRWYCSWVCGCGGLAETVGDPFRQLSSKKLVAWKIERIIIYSVLVIVTFVTTLTLINIFSGGKLLGSATDSMQTWYGFAIGSVFAGVIGTGLYPIMGNRVWCRFGCPLSAIFGIIQRYKSRFRITTNGGQCISCGNCSTYCEMGIDVRSYAQKGQNVVRASCVGCGICAEVCPRGVLKLENGKEEGRINNDPIIIGNGSIKVRL
jgi:ferredoxin-type protein NapH